MTGSWRRRRRLAAGALAAALFAPPGAASPEDVLGFGARSMGMGGTGVAAGEGHEAVYLNPSLLARERVRRLSLGGLAASFDLAADGAAPAHRAAQGTLRAVVLGATLPVPFGGVLRHRLALGLGAITPTELLVRGRMLDPTRPQFPVKERVRSVAVQGALGAALAPGLRVGAGFAALAALEGSVLVATDASGRVGTTVSDTLVASYGPIVGASLDLGGEHRLGATVRGELVGRMDVVIHVHDLGSLRVPPLHISGVSQYDPAQVAVEAARVAGPLRLALGVTYKRWSQYPGALEATVRCPPNEPCAAPAPTPPGYRDTWVPRIGVERRVRLARGLEVRARGGYQLEPTPAPEQRGEANLFEESRSALSVGYGLLLDVPLPGLELDWFLSVHALHGRTHRKGETVPATNAGHPAVRTSGRIVATGVSVSVAY